jgi:DNA-binding transcriptional LysR family regulator
MSQIDNFDLNLLRIFDSLWRHRHLGRASEELGVSQPALSHSLKRLREQIGDALFIKSRNGVQPSSRAVDLAPIVQSILASVRQSVLLAPAFDPLTAQRTFAIAMSDLGEMTFLPKMLGILATKAPGVDIVTVSMPPRDLMAVLQRGEVDLAMGYFPDLQGSDIFQQRLFHHGFVCLVSSRHPLARSGLTREQFLELSHAVVQTEGRTQEIVEQYLKTHGLKRRELLRCPHFLSIPMVIASTNLIVTVPESVGKVFSSTAGLCALQAPFDFPAYDVKQHWHRCQHDDPGNRWLRSELVKLFCEPL